MGHSETHIFNLSNYSCILDFHHLVLVTLVSVNHQNGTVSTEWPSSQSLLIAHLHPLKNIQQYSPVLGYQ